MSVLIPDSASSQVRDALAHADMRVLLMVAFHLTGDNKWLQPPYLPQRDVRLIADESAGFSREIQDEIRAAVASWLASKNPKAAIDDPGDELMVKMMRVCLGETVPAEYAPMMREQIGFAPRNTGLTSATTVAGTSDAEKLVAIAATKPASNGLTKPVLIVGAGASGLSVGVRLLESGIPFVIVEKASEVGGTWRENRYPGCSVDTPNHAYSFSNASPYPWSRFFSPRDQLQDYLERSATEFGLRPHIRFDTGVSEASWNETKTCWQVVLQTPDGAEVFEASALVSAIGQLSLPSIPRIDGDTDFDGDLFHSAQWPAELDYRGKHVAVIGTGATAMQVVPTIADEVASVTVYQRSAQWARPIERFHDAIDPNAQWLFEHLPFYANWYRFTMLWRYGDGLLPSLHIDPDWPHPERSLNRANDRHRVQITEHIQDKLAGHDDLIAKCLPDYPPYGKRILLDNHWYDTLLKPNVTLVTNGISRIEKDGVRDSDERLRAADIIVLATGFIMGPMAARLNIIGRGDVNLSDAWADNDPRAYVGITVPGFPNFFCTQGPATGLGHGGSAIFTGECQANYIVACLTEMQRRGSSSMEVRQEPHDEYMASVDAEHRQMIWSHPGMSTYYRNEKGRVFSVMPWRLVDYWSMTREPRVDHYDWAD